MSSLLFTRLEAGERFGVKGPRAAEWLSGRGLVLPPAPNSWSGSPDAAGADGLMVARLGTTEFFAVDASVGGRLRELKIAVESPSPGVYPVLREDVEFALSGAGATDVLAEVCNVNFGDLDLGSRPVIMTLMMGVSVLVAPQMVNGTTRYRIWCDPTFGDYLGESLGQVVMESGGSDRHNSQGDSA